MAKNIDYATPFAAWEARLYLDTHPRDARALAYYKQLCNKCGGYDNYACLPECEYSGDVWRWVDDPWPWDSDFNCPCQNPAPGQYQRRGQ